MKGTNNNTIEYPMILSVVVFPAPLGPRSPNNIALLDLKTDFIEYSFSIQRFCHIFHFNDRHG